MIKWSAVPENYFHHLTKMVDMVSNAKVCFFLIKNKINYIIIIYEFKIFTTLEFFLYF